ncbi:MAG: polysaccharide deacetylase family protein, partial [Actinomycetota bacterium]|nr:polysaccharide deacetylase family protein [Actinomycetota bacterium]
MIFLRKEVARPGYALIGVLVYPQCRRLVFIAVSSILFALVLSSCGRSTPQGESERSQPAEQQSRTESTSAANPSQSIDEAWAIATMRDASPSLATPGESIGFGGRIALTFDDGPDPTTTPTILDVLRQYGLKATFFVVGARVEQYPELVERIVSEGHTLGNHTYNHRDMTKLDQELALQELQDTQAVIDQALGYHYPITLYRPPCGAPYITETDKLPTFQKVMQEQKMYPVMWNVDSRDWALEGQPDLVFDNVLQGTPGEGGVILLHDTQPQTADALPRILDYYTAAAFEFTGVRELLAEKYGVE